MKPLLSLFVAQVVWVALGHTGVTSTPVASLVVKRQARVMMQDEPVETPTSTMQTSSENPKPKIYSMHVTSHIEYRFANTLISSRVANPANVSQEVFFSFTLPETAFISKFLMEVDGKVYEATVKEKKQAKQTYDAAVSAGLGAAHVAVSARDSNVFTVSVNVEPAKKVNFNLTYEELLIRRLGAYNHVINLDPGQIVSDLRVDVYIKEHKNITVLRVPELRSGNEVDADETTAANPLARIERRSGEEAHISFAPTVADQKKLGRVPGLDNKKTFGYPTAPKVIEGLGGQFVVQYDVDRSDEAGEVLVNNGYFVHFFSPAELTPLPKHAVFVLDLSGSMIGHKLEQLKQAMNVILDDLNEGDYFNVIAFSYNAKVWDLDAPASRAELQRRVWSYDGEETPTENQAPVPAFPATRQYIAKAKEIVNQMQADGGTNIHEAVKTAIRVTHEGLKNVTSPSAGEERQHNPIIVFLTDGEPTVGETSLNKIFSVVQELNTDPEAALFSLAFGNDADLEFLKKLSLKNSGFARKIYEASDAALQLRDFYRQISSPLLANVTFSYQPDKIEQSATTKTRFHTLFSGSEIIVAGKIKPTTDEKVTDLAIEGHITGLSYTGDSTFVISRPYPVLQEESHPVTSLERLWAYLTIQQLLEQQAKGEAEEAATAVLQDSDLTSATNESLANHPISPKKKALDLALKYSFVTPLTSLVVVKPNSTTETDALHTAGGNEPGSYMPGSRSGAVLSTHGSKSVMRVGSSGSSYSGHYQSNALVAGRSPMMGHRISAPRPVYHQSPIFSIGAAYDAERDELEVMRPSGTVPPPSIRPLPSSHFATSIPAAPSQTTPVLIGLEELEWLEDASNGTDTITLPFDVLIGNKTYKLERNNNQTSVDLRDCWTLSGVEGQCRHLAQCSLSSFKHDIQEYNEYFCVINHFAGACCPKSLFPQATTSLEPSSETSTTTTV